MDAEAVNTAAKTAGRNLVAIAPNGTALTAGHLAALNRIAPLADRTVIEAFDSDAAGRAAADKAHTLLANMHIHDAVSVTGLTGKDPAQMLTDTGPAALLAAVDEHRPLTDATLDRIIDQFDTADGTVESRYHAMAAVVPTIAALPREEIIDQTIRVAAAVPWDTDRAIDWVARHIPDQPTPATPPAPHQPTATGDDLGLPPRPVLSTDRTPPRSEETAAGSLLTRTHTDTAADAAIDAPAEPVALDTDPRRDDLTDLDIARRGDATVLVEPAPATPDTALDIAAADSRPAELAADHSPDTGKPITDAAEPTREVEQHQDHEAQTDPAPELADQLAAGDTEQRAQELAAEETAAPGPHADLPDQILAEEIGQATAEYADAQRVAAAAAEKQIRVAAAVAQDQGREMTRLRARIEANSQRLAAIAAAQQSIAVTDQAMAASTAIGVQLAAANRELDSVRGRRRTEQAQARVEQLTQARQQAQDKMVDLETRSQQLIGAAGTPAQQQEALATRNQDAYRSRLAELAQLAREEDARAVEYAQEWATSQQLRQEKAAEEVAQLTAEQTHRALYPDPAAELRRQEIYNEQQEELEAADAEYTSPDWDVPAVADHGIER